jgi:hypothetical protein
MASEIKDKFTTSAALTITLASLASSPSGVGRQSTLVDNTTTRYAMIKIYAKFTLGISPTGSRAVYLFLISSDKDATTPSRDDGAGASDQAWTRLNADLIKEGRDQASPSTGDVVLFSGIIDNPGPEWGVGVYQDTGVALNSTGGNHWIRWIGINPEGQ